MRKINSFQHSHQLSIDEIIKKLVDVYNSVGNIKNVDIKDHLLPNDITAGFSLIGYYKWISIISISVIVNSKNDSKI